MKFYGTEFGDHSDFEQSRFDCNAWFAGASFDDHVSFTDAIFSEHASFWEAKFSDIARFTRTKFGKTTEFGHATFIGGAYFTAMSTNGAISFDEACFESVAPKFNQAVFHTPPRLDSVHIVEALPFLWKGDRLRAANYRDLKRLAADAKDYFREQTFFASELRERRGNDDPVGSARWVFGITYELLSDFGRSFLRPIVALATLSTVFTLLYILAHDLPAWQNCGPDGLLPMGKATYLSLINSLPFIGLGKTEQIKLVSECLYGGKVLPLGITLLTTVQTILSTVLIFLFFLAVRNHFKIK